MSAASFALVAHGYTPIADSRNVTTEQLINLAQETSETGPVLISEPLASDMTCLPLLAAAPGQQHNSAIIIARGKQQAKIQRQCSGDLFSFEISGVDEKESSSLLGRPPICFAIFENTNTLGQLDCDEFGINFNSAPQRPKTAAWLPNLPSFTMTSPWEVFGGPPRHELVPGGRRSPVLLSYLQKLHDKLTRHNCFVRFRTCGKVWAVLHCFETPRALTWDLLCGHLTLSDLICAVNRESRCVDTSFCFWNTRWLADPHCVSSIAKRAVIRQNIARNRIVGLVDTHWANKDHGIWASLFPTAQVVHSNASSNNARAPGGVAIIVPPCYEVLEHQEVIQGYCLALTLKDITKNVVFICMVAYLRTWMRMDILKELQDKYPTPNIPLFFSWRPQL